MPENILKIIASDVLSGIINERCELQIVEADAENLSIVIIDKRDIAATGSSSYLLPRAAAGNLGRILRHYRDSGTEKEIEKTVFDDFCDCCGEDAHRDDIFKLNKIQLTYTKAGGEFNLQDRYDFYFAPGPIGAIATLSLEALNELIIFMDNFDSANCVGEAEKPVTG